MAAKRPAKERLSRYDTVNYLKSEKDMVAYLKACIDEAGDDETFIAHVLSDIARAIRITKQRRILGQMPHKPDQKPLADWLTRIPRVGEDSDFERIED